MYELEMIRNTKIERSYLFQVIGHFELALLRGNIGLDFRVCVVDDRQKHVEQDEEDEEDIEDEVGRAEDAVCLLQSLEVEITKDDAEQRESANSITRQLAAYK